MLRCCSKAQSNRIRIKVSIFFQTKQENIIFFQFGMILFQFIYISRTDSIKCRFQALLFIERKHLALSRVREILLSQFLYPFIDRCLWSASTLVISPLFPTHLSCPSLKACRWCLSTCGLSGEGDVDTQRMPTRSAPRSQQSARYVPPSTLPAASE